MQLKQFAAHFALTFFRVTALSWAYMAATRVATAWEAMPAMPYLVTGQKGELVMYNPNGAMNRRSALVNGALGTALEPGQVGWSSGGGFDTKK